MQREELPSRIARLATSPRRRRLISSTQVLALGIGYIKEHIFTDAHKGLAARPPSNLTHTACRRAGRSHTHAAAAAKLHTEEEEGHGV